MLVRPAARADLARVVALANAYDVAVQGAPDTDESDVRDVWDEPGFDMSGLTRVVEATDRLVGYACCDTSGNVDVVLALPDDRGVQPLLLGWLEGLGRPLRMFCTSEDVSGVLTSRGWHATRTVWRMRRDLAGPLAEPVWPRGVHVREMSPSADGRAVHALVQAAFGDVGDGHVPQDYARWAGAMLDVPGFQPRLSLVAVAGADLAGACLAHDKGDVAFVRQLAVPVPRRGHGVALALLQESFLRHREYGLPATMLGVDAANATGATRLYERAGMQVTSAFTRWEFDA